MLSHRSQMRRVIKKNNQHWPDHVKSQVAQQCMQQCKALLQNQPECRRVAIYLPLLHEIDTWPLIHQLWQLDYALYLPRMQP